MHLLEIVYILYTQIEDTNTMKWISLLRLKLLDQIPGQV